MLSGVIIYFPKSSDEKGTASIDRINPNQHYTINNIQWVHKDVNNMKFSLDEDCFLYLCKLIVNPLKHDNQNEDCIVNKSKHYNWKGYGNLSGDYWSRIIKNTLKSIKKNR